MARFFRVHPYLPTAVHGEKGHPLFVMPNGRSHRIDNPDEYAAFYVSESAAGAFAEVYENENVWDRSLFEPPEHTPGSIVVISEFEGDPQLVNLDDGNELVALNLRPSRVVTRNRQLTQAWALGVFHTRGGSGVRWWSYHDPDWASVGLWDTSMLRVIRSTPLDLNNPSFIEASAVLHRRIKR